MKANELMIGDWVLDKEVSDKPVQVVQINDKNVHYKRGNGYISAGFECLDPVPLTADILELNGFSDNYINDDLCYAMACGDIIGIHINGKGGCMEEMYFTNVHELQHAMRLCGFDNEIKLEG